MSSHLIAPASNQLLDSLHAEKAERFTLPNGLTVVFKEDHSSALTSVQVWVKTGSIHEAENMGSGLSHYLEHMLFKGTKKRVGREISMLVQGSGGYINAYTTFDRTVYYIDIPSEHAPVALDILSDAVFGSTLPAEEVEKERGVILREIDMCLDDPQQLLGQSLFDTAFREHPYRAPIIGYREVFETVTREDLVRYYESRYVPNNTVLVIVGDWDSKKCREEVEHYFGALTRRKVAPVFIPTEPEQLGYRENRLRGDVQVSHTGMGFKIPGMAHPDSPALKILASVLGYGSSSVLWKVLRDERQLVHQIDVSTWNPGTAGLFLVSFVADPEFQEKAVEVVNAELEKLKTELVDKKLIQKTIRQALVGEVNIRKTMQGQAARLGSAEVVIGDLDFPEVYLKQLAAVTPEDIRRVSQKYLRREKMTRVSLDPEDSPALAAEPVAAARQIGEFQRFNLANGSRLLMQQDRRLPNIHLRVILRGGPVYETPEIRGATSLLATLLTKDTTKRSKDAVAESIESAGGAFSNFAGNNTFGLAIEVLPDDLSLALDLLQEALLAPTFHPETFEREREGAIAFLKEDLDEIFDFGRKVLRRRFFGDHPFAIEPEGTLETLGKLTVAQIRDLYTQLVSSENVTLSVVGDFDETELRPRLETLLNQIPTRGFSPQNAMFSGPTEPGVFRETIARKQAIVFQAYPDLGIKHPGYPVSEVADEIFSGMSSNLFERVREELSLAYFVGSSRSTGLNTGIFYFYAGTDPTTVDDVIRELDREILRVQEGGVTQDELSRCQRRLKAGKRMGLQASGARAMDAGLSLVFGLPLDWKQYDSRIDAVTLEDLQNFAREQFRPEKKVLLVVGPETPEAADSDSA